MCISSPPSADSRKATFLFYFNDISARNARFSMRISELEPETKSPSNVLSRFCFKVLKGLTAETTFDSVAGENNLMDWKEAVMVVDRASKPNVQGDARFESTKSDL